VFRTKHAFATQPLSLWYKWDTIAVLMHSQIASIAEHYSIAILYFPIVADSAVLGHFIALLGHILDQFKPEFL
jgi:cytochrome c oxidase assembly factor CtaG